MRILGGTETMKSTFFSTISTFAILSATFINIRPNNSITNENIIISDERFVSGTPRSQEEVQINLESHSSFLTELNLEPVEGFELPSSSACLFLARHMESVLQYY
jgi:hypothetical protein